MMGDGAEKLQIGSQAQRPLIFTGFGFIICKMRLRLAFLPQVWGKEGVDELRIEMCLSMHDQ